MKANQIGATEGSGNNWIGSVFHVEPSPVPAVAPPVELAKRNSRQRIDLQIEDCLEIRERAAPARTRDSGRTVLMHIPAIPSTESNKV